MNHLFKFFLVTIIVISLSSCDNELEVNAPFKEVPVVYGILDQSEDVQYIRVERVFIDKDNTVQVSKNPDSLYYEDITVKLQIENDPNEYILERVDGNEIGLVRDTGIFAQTPNILYRINTEDIPLNFNDVVTLSIEGVFEDRNIESTTTLIEQSFFASPQTDGVIELRRGTPLNIGWSPGEGAVSFSATFYINVIETIDGIDSEKRLRWVVDPNTDDPFLDNDEVEFYSFLVGALEKNSEITRRIRNLEFELISVGENISDYINVADANLGITSSGEIPVFTNISEGVGVFGAKNTQRRTNISITGRTIDSLMNSNITRDLNFDF